MIAHLHAASMTPEPVLDAQGLSVFLGKHRAVDDVSLSLKAGELTVLAGPNGAGKTTLLRALAGLAPLASGRVMLQGADLGAWTRNERARRIAYLAQAGGVTWPVSVHDVVALGRLPHGASLDNLGAMDEAVIGRALAAVALEQFGERSVTTLSGGERSRALLARALAVDAPILLLDEPAAALDPRHQLQVMDVLAAEAARGRAVLAVMHDLALAARFAQRMIVMGECRVISDGTPGKVLREMGVAATFGVAIDTEDRAHGLQVVIRRARD
jgi:iron complex transport system ATP-binding protein